MTASQWKRERSGGATRPLISLVLGVSASVLALLPARAIMFTMMAQREFTGVYKRRGKWVVAWVEEVPGANTQGRTHKEARENLREALFLILAENRRIAREHDSAITREPLRLAVPA